MEGVSDEPQSKKQRTEANIQLLGTTAEVVTMTTNGQGQPILAGGVSLISSNSTMVPMMAPKTYMASGVKTITMTPQGQVIGSNVRPGVTMTSVIRPSLQLQAVQTGQPKVIPGIQGHVQLRPGIVNQAASASRPVVQYATPVVGQARPTVQLNASTIQQLSGSQKMTFQITPPGVRAIPPRSPIAMAPRSPITIPQVMAVAPGVARYTAMPTVAAPAPLMPRYTTMHTAPQVVHTGILPNQHMNKELASPNIQLQARVPSSRSNTAGPAAKSLLDPPNKSPGGDVRSLLEAKVVSCVNSSVQKTVPIASDTKVIESRLLSSVQASQKLSQGRNSPPVVSSNIQQQTKLTKSGSFIIHSGKPVTFVPATQSSSQVVTQIVKTDSVSSTGKVTMAEAQIMLPSGPATISWPIPPKTTGTSSDGGKQYVMAGNQIIRSVPTTGKLVVGKQVVSSASSSPTRPAILGSNSMSRIKVSGAGSPVKVMSVSDISKNGSAVSTKSNVLPVQKNWELVKQSTSLLQQKSDSGSAVIPNSQKVTDTNASTFTASDSPQSATSYNIETVTDSTLTSVTESNSQNASNAVSPTVRESVTTNVIDPNSLIVTDSAPVVSTDLPDTNSKVLDGRDEFQKPDVENKAEDSVQNRNITSEIEPDVGTNNSTEQTGKTTHFDATLPLSDVGFETCSAESADKVANHSGEKELENSEAEINGDSVDAKSTDNTLECATENTNVTENMDSEITKGSSDGENDETASGNVEEQAPSEYNEEENANVETHEDGVEADVKESMEVDNVDQIKESKEFDPVNAMEWSDGVGKLEGSNMKFRMNELGVLEMITDDLECVETLNTSNESDRSSTKVTEVTIIKPDPDGVRLGNKVMEVVEGGAGNLTNRDEIGQCDHCGEYGFKTDFHDQGPFCSVACLVGHDDKQSRDTKRQPVMLKAELNLKRNKKKVGLGTCLSEIKREPGTSGGRKVSKAFVWTRYLEAENAKEAPARLFKNAFPSAKNGFRVGMKLEGVDPEHQSLFCVLSVAEVCGHRIRLHFDGYSECFDFWTDIDSPYIFPVGFCEKNSKTLQPPKGFTVTEFNWPLYQKITKGISAPKSLFSNQLSGQAVNGSVFRVGGRMEAVDKKNSSLICVASVANSLGDLVLVHFDGWDDDYDYWCDTTAPYLHPAGHCDSLGFVLSPPPDWTEADFTWDKYLAKLQAQSVPAKAFKPRLAVPFEVGMKVEVVDKRNPILVRVATILQLDNYMVKIHYDGWSDTYDYWLDDDSPELHPPGWCAKTGHPLVPPITPSDLVVTNGPGICPTPGCKGLGHIKGPKYSGHHSMFGCPYSSINMNKESVVGDRLGNVPRPEETVAAAPAPAACDDTPPIATETKLSVTQPHTQQNGDIVKKLPRGRRPKSYYQNLEDVKAARENGEEQEKSFRQGIHNSVFDTSSMVTTRSDSPFCWEQHSKLLPGVTSIHGNEVTKWTTDEVMEFVEQLPGCEVHAQLFKDEQIDGEAFLLLTQSDIVKIMNIKLGPALKIFNSIIMFKNSISV